MVMVLANLTAVQPYQQKNCNCSNFLQTNLTSIRIILDLFWLKIQKHSINCMM